MTRKEKGLTELQREAMQCLEAARRAGTTLSTQVRLRGLKLRRVYDALAPLVRRGQVLALGAAKGPRRASAPLHFARVRVRERVPITADAGSMTLRLSLMSGRSAELEVADVDQLTQILAALERAA